MPRLFALDHNFPDPIVSVLAGFQTDAELVRIDQIHSVISLTFCTVDITNSLSCSEAWDGLITTDSSMLNQGPELATLIQTKLTLVVATASGDDPVKASGLLFAYLSGICKRTRPDVAQVWTLSAANRPAHESLGSAAASSWLITTTERPRMVWGRSPT